jgi:hypothetical protein
VTRLSIITTNRQANLDGSPTEHTMPTIHLHVEGDNALKGKQILHHDPEGFHMLALKEGMESGCPSAAVAIQTPGGMVVAECSLVQLKQAVDTIWSVHGPK